MIFLALVLMISSCGKSPQKEEVPEYVTEPGQVRTLESGAEVVALSPESEKLVSGWPEYQALSQLIVQYRVISKSDALLNSVELEELARQLKDSIRVEKLDIASVRMRLNVLHNEAKRLSDMSTIPTITDDEVLYENDNLLNAYAALNIKINDLSRQERINRELEKFDDGREVIQDSLPPPPKPGEKKILKQIN
jgi:hypothetical protein